MSKVTTVGRLLLKHYTPASVHPFIDSHDLESKNLSSLFVELSKGNPDIYKESVTNLTRLGFEVATRMGSTVRLSDLLSPVDKDKKFADLEADIKTLKERIKDPRKFTIALNDLYSKFSKDIEKEIVEVGVKKNQTLAKVIRSGARGKPSQYRQTVFSPVVVDDAQGNPMTEFVIKNSYAEGLSLPEYLVSSFGSRQGSVSTKLAVADAGYLNKQLSRATMTLKVEEHDCGTDEGIPVSVSDKDSIGCFLAKPIGGFKKNNEVNALMLNELHDKHFDTLIVRSPITCHSSRKSHSAAVCQMCVGRREYQHLMPIGSHVGLTASSGLGEVLSQSTLNKKHTATASGGGGGTASTITGFKLVNQLFNIPKSFPEKAAVAEVDGKITDIKPAVQGGTHIYQGEHEYYVPVGFEPKVKVGDIVEAGDIISEGLVNPAEIVKHKGIGEGRRYFSTAMKSAFDDSGMGGINRRNFELISKSAIDHVRITHPEGLGGYLPGQIASYQSIEKDYQPRHGSILSRIDQAYNKYLEVPVLHYSIGTRITHRVIDDLKKNGVESITVNEDKPDFTPEMQRLLDVPIYEPDIFHQLYSTNLERKLINAVNTGASSDLRGPSPIAGLAYGVGFGVKGHKFAEEEVADEEKLGFE